MFLRNFQLGQKIADRSKRTKTDQAGSLSVTIT